MLNICTNLQISSVDSDSSLRNMIFTNKLKINRPDTSVLSNRQCSQCSVKCAPWSRHLALVHQKLTIIYPDPWHLERCVKKISSWDVFKESVFSLQKIINVWCISLWYRSAQTRGHDWGNEPWAWCRDGNPCVTSLFLWKSTQLNFQRKHLKRPQGTIMFI